MPPMAMAHLHPNLKEINMGLESVLLSLANKFILDPACSVIKEEVEEFLEEHLNDSQKKAMDLVVESMPENSFKSVKEFLG